MNDKNLAIQELQRLGVRVPISFTIMADEIARLEEMLASYQRIPYWHLRLSQGAKDIPANVSSIANLAYVLKKAFEVHPHAEITVQERIDVYYSGVFARVKDAMLIEYVKGALKSLLRDGVTPSRLVLDDNGNGLLKQINEQEYWYIWEGEQLVRESVVIPEALAPETYRYLHTVATRFSRNVVCEWVIDRDGLLSFLDIKTLPDQFLVDKKCLLTGMKRNSILTLDISFCGKVVREPLTTSGGIFFLEKPLHVYMEHVLKYSRGFVIAHGGALSHLPVYAGQRLLPCLISRSYYDEWLHLAELHISSPRSLFN